MEENLVQNPFSLRGGLSVDPDSAVIVPEARPPLHTEEELRKEANEAVGFIGGLKNEWGTVKARMLLASPSPFDFTTQYEPTAEERKKILETVDYNLDRYKSIVRGANSKEDMESRIGIVKEVQEYRRQQSMASIADNLASGVGGMFGDPTSYIPFAGGASMAGRLSLAAGSAVFSGFANEYVSGDENDPVDNLANAVMLGGTVEGFSRVRGKMSGAGRIVGDAGRRAMKTAKDIANDTVQDFKYLKGIRGTIGAINGLRENLEKHLPSATIAGVFQKAKSIEIKDIANKFFKTEEGIRDPNTGIFKQFNNEKGTFTAEEYKDFYFNEGYRFFNEVADGINKLSKEINMSVEEINHRLRRKQEGFSTDLDNNATFNNISKMFEGFYGSRGDKLKGAGMIDGKVTPELFQYESRSYSRTRVADWLNRMKGKTREAQKKALKTKISKLLMRTLKDSKYRALWEAKYKENLKSLATKANSKNEPIPTEINEKDFLDFVQKEADSDALGIVDQSVGIQKGLYDDPENFQFNYRKTRNPWKITEEDVDGFSIDRLLRDVSENMDSYNRRTSADLGVYDSFGINNYKDLEKRIDDAIEAEVKLAGDTAGALKTKKQQRDAFRALMNAYYGRSGMDNEDAASFGNALSEALRNFTFFTKNVFMGFLNHFETAEAIKAYGASFMIKSIPKLEERLNDWSHGGMTRAERRDIINNQFGMESKMRGIWREIDNRNLERFNGNKWLARMVSGTEWLSTNSPFTKYLNASNESITDCARGIFMGDLVRFAHSRVGDRKFFTEDVLKRLNIDEEGFNDLLEGIRKGTRVTKDRLEFTDKFAKEVEENMDRFMLLRRLGDYVASETILRPSLGDTFIWRGSNKSHFLNAAMQFKSFALRSYRKRLIKMGNRLEEGDAIGQALTMSIAGALGLMSYVGQTAMVVSGMNEEQRRLYFKNTIGVEELNDIDGATLANVAINGSMRSSILAYPSLLVNLAGLKVGIKSTSDQGIEDRDEAGQLNGEAILRSMFPSYNTVKGLYGIQSDTRNLIDAGLLNPDEFLDSDRERYAKSFGRNLKAITPNIPLVQQGLINMITDNED